VRFAALVLVFACSSSTKPTDEAPAPAPASTAAAGSGADPWATKPRDPAADLAALRADIDVMCSAAKVTGGTTFNEVGPHIAENMKTAFKLELFEDFRTRTLDEIIERMRKGMAKANVQQCDTVDVLIANDPRKKR
jgi:hypothetical protein